MINIINKFNVTRGGKPRSKALPGIIKITENHLVIAYRDASVHPVGEHKKIDDGVIKIVRSFDGGSTWGKTFLAWLDKDWDCAGSRTLIVTPIGLIMFVFKAKRANLKSPISTIQTILSTDNGYNWKPYGKNIHLYADWTEMNTSGNLHILNNGSWIVPVYGSDEPNGPTYPAIAQSKDEGLSWTIISSIKTNDKVELHECSIAKTNDDTFFVRSYRPSKIAQ